MPEKEVIKEVAQHGSFVQWFIDIYGWAFVIIGILVGWIFRRADKRITDLEEGIDKRQTKRACKEFREGIKDESVRIERDCEKDVAILKNDMTKALDKIDESIGGVHQRLDRMFEEKNRKRGD